MLLPAMSHSSFQTPRPTPHPRRPALPRALTRAGTFGGGAFGVVEGLNKAPRNTARVRINSMLNYSGRRGSKAGNALGSVALLFTMMEGVGEQIELEHLIDSAGVPTVVAPMAAAAATGLIYKGTKGPRVMAVYAAAGCVAALGMELASTAFVEQRIM